MNADEFAQALKITVPARIAARGRRVYFDAATQLHAAMVRGTPVDTGYLRASLTAHTGAQPAAFEARDAAGVTARRWRNQRERIAGALTESVAQIIPLTFTFRASYAQYVEDSRGMVKQARARWREFCDKAIRNADTKQVAGKGT